MKIKIKKIRLIFESKCIKYHALKQSKLRNTFLKLKSQIRSILYRNHLKTIHVIMMTSYKSTCINFPSLSTKKMVELEQCNSILAIKIISILIHSNRFSFCRLVFCMNLCKYITSAHFIGFPLSLFYLIQKQGY